MEPKKKHVWLDTNNWKFSNSWDAEESKIFDQDALDAAKEKGWKLIEFTCLNDPDFEFMNQMKLR